MSGQSVLQRLLRFDSKEKKIPIKIIKRKIPTNPSVDYSSEPIVKKSKQGEFNLACKECPDRIEHSSHLISHELLQCEECEIKFDSQQRLAKHATSQLPLLDTIVHDDTAVQQNSHSCNKCGLTINDIDLYREHMKSHQIYICKICDLQFGSQHSLSSHSGVHKRSAHKKASGQRKKLPAKECEYCPSTFTNLTLPKHLLETHKIDPQPFYCYYCDQRFPLKQLIQHLASHKVIVKQKTLEHIFQQQPKTNKMVIQINIRNSLVLPSLVIQLLAGIITVILAIKPLLISLAILNKPINSH
jgi:predicted nucleic acid-binding Zn ribbon protein